MTRPNPCVFCKSLPGIMNLAGLYYVYCPGCKKYAEYEFMGRTPQLAYESWNAVNNKDTRITRHFVRNKILQDKK